MALHVHRAERTDLLADGLGALLATPQPDPFAEELVVVPARGVERWLSQRLSHVLGRGSGADRQWDWSADTAGDALIDQLAVALDDQWYAGSFPGGRFVIAVDATTDGVYAADDRGLYLLGLASHDEAPPGGKTLLPYAAPVAVLRLPVAAGDRWTETATITGGTLRGLPYNGTDTYAISADAHGELHLPYVRFTDALRVRTTVTSTPAVGGASVVVRQTQFFSECFGEIGRATSRPGELADDFTTAATLRRLAL